MKNYFWVMSFKNIRTHDIITNIVFVIDATVSMDNWLVAVKKSVTELVSF
jgi:hypothetical protein